MEDLVIQKDGFGVSLAILAIQCSVSRRLLDVGMELQPPEVSLLLTDKEADSVQYLRAA